MKKIQTLALLALMGICVFAQVNVNGNRKFLGSVDASEAQVTKPFREVLTVPSGSCANPGQMVQLTLSARLFLCNGTWQEIGGSGGPGAVSSVFGRTGTIAAQAGDYSAFYPSLSGSYENPSWINSLAWSKLTGVPLSFTPSAHTQTTSTITDFASASRALFRAGSGLAYNEATGEYSCTGCSGGPVSVEWNDVLNKPSTFAPSAHTHAYSSLTDIPSTFVPSAHTQTASTITDFLAAARLAYTGDGCININPSTGAITYTCSPTVEWSTIENKPETFPPGPHTHQPSEVFDIGPGLLLTDIELSPDDSILTFYSSGSGAAPSTGHAGSFHFRNTGQLYYYAATDTPVRIANFSDLSNISANSITSDTLAVARGGTGNTAPAANEILIGNASSGYTKTAIPECANGTTDKLLYNASTHSFSCGTDQTGGGGSGGFLLVATPGGGVGSSATQHTVAMGRGSAAWGTAGSFNTYMPASGTVRNCYIHWRTSQTGSDLVISLLKNGIATGIAFTITNADGSTGSQSDLVTTVSVTAGDYLAWEGVNGLASTSAIISTISCLVN